jgi:gliding motility-associated-like protein
MLHTLTKLLLAATLALCYHTPLQAQLSLHNAIWYFGCGHSLSFSPSGPVPGSGIPNPSSSAYNLHSGEPRAAIALADTNGHLLCFTQIRNSFNNANSSYPYIFQTIKIFDRNGQPFPLGNIEASAADGAGNPLLVPYPGKSHLYYLFYVRAGALLYSLINMELNNGLGDLVPNQKDIKLTNYGAVEGRKITTTLGCRQIWLIARSHIANQYLSFAITEQGLTTVPQISNIGSLPLNAYNYISVSSTTSTLEEMYYGGVLAASPNGRYIAVGTNKGIELYDVAPCSGRLSNARIIDTVPALGLCFSPDNTKLYSTQMEKEWGWVPRGKLYQYSLQPTNMSATLASKTTILENTLISWGNSGYTSGYLGDIKMGPDGKLYVAGNNEYLAIGPPPQPTPPATSLSLHQEMHIIHLPNLPGLLCQPEPAGLLLAGSRYLSAGLMLPQPILRLNPTIIDTAASNTYTLHACFNPSATAQAPAQASCILWDDGSTEPQRQLTQAGTYWLSYYLECTYHTDTFKLQYTPLPAVPQQLYGCPGQATLSIPAADSNITYTYTLYNAQGILVATASHNKAQYFSGLQAGNYTLHIQNTYCDTTLALTIQALALPELHTTPTDTTINYGDTLTLEATGAYLYTWSPTAHIDTATKAKPMAWPPKTTQYEVIGINTNGCYASAQVRVKVKYQNTEAIPNAFSPNGDGLNDVFKLYNLHHQKLSYMYIYNRWGQLLYTNTNPEQGWDGNYQGKPCDAGTYYYTIGLVYPDGSTKNLKGDLNLIR